MPWWFFSCSGRRAIIFVAILRKKESDSWIRRSLKAIPGDLRGVSICVTSAYITWL